MAGDYSRIADGLFRRYCAVLKQQGRVDLDSDWNAFIGQSLRRWTTQAADTFGPAAVPAQTTPDGFLISGISGSATDFSIGAGRCYVDGLQAEAFHDETVGGKPVSYLNQPFYPDPPPLAAGGGLIFLDVWEREVASVQDPKLLDVALGGVDTTTRLQTIWQVKALASATGGPPLTCGFELSSQFAPSAGRIDTRAVGPTAPADPCILPDEGGYRGIENRLYRVEIHKGGDTATALWKWSRENASVVSRVTAIKNSASSSTLTVDRIGRDDVLRFGANDWVEVTDDHHELLGLPGVVAQIVGQPDESSLTIALSQALPTAAPGFDLNDPASRHTRIIRWDQKSGVGSDGLLPIASGWTALEDGVEVKLELDSKAPGGQFNPGDFWCFAARTADASVETLAGAPPLGIIHHYCALATYTLPTAGPLNPSSCRVLWPPVTTAADTCACTVCVDAHEHNTGVATLAMAIETVRPTGGRICLGPGAFNLGVTTLLMEGLTGVTLMGQGLASALVFGGSGVAIEVSAAIGLRLQDLSIVAVAVAPVTAGPPSAAIAIGVLARNSLEVAIERCWIVALPPEAGAGASAGSLSPSSAAVAIDGFLVEGLFRDNVLIGDVGLAKAGLFGAASGSISKSALFSAAARDLLAAGNLQIVGNWMPCAMAGVAILDEDSEGALTFFALDVAIEKNRILGCADVGVSIAGVALPDAGISIAANHIDVGGDGIDCAVDATVIEDNFVTQAMTGAPSSSAAPTAASLGVSVRSIPGGALAIDEARILRNRVTAFDGAGVSVTGLVRVASIADNAIINVTGSGVVVAGGAASYEAIIRENEIFAVSSPAPPATGAVLPGPALDSASIGAVWNAPAPSAALASIVAGIRVSGLPLATIEDNSVAAIGVRAAPARDAVGVLLVEVPTATISGNDIGDIGPTDGSGVLSFGVAVANGATTPSPSKRSDVSLSGNAIRQSSGAVAKNGNFVGIELRLDAPEAATISASATDNSVTGDTRKSLILVNTRGDCLLNGNRCYQSAATDVAPVVDVVAGTAIAGSNRIACDSKATAMAISVAAAKPIGATVVGNITGGAVTLQGLPLAAPWELLNVRV